MACRATERMSVARTLSADQPRMHRTVLRNGDADGTDTECEWLDRRSLLWLQADGAAVEVPVGFQGDAEVGEGRGDDVDL